VINKIYETGHRFSSTFNCRNIMKGQKTLALALLVAGLFIAAYYPIFKILAIKWARSEDYTHAFFTVPIILYMAWLKKETLVEGEGWKKTGLIWMVIATVLYVVSLQLQVPSFIAMSMVLMVSGAVLYLSGFHALLEMLIPLLLLILLIPVPDQLLSMLTSSLQFKVSQASEVVLELLNVPLFREGNVLHTPEKTFQVVEACSGIRSLMSLITLSLIFGYFSLKNNRSRAILLVLSIPVAVLVNIVRVIALVLAYHYFRLDLSSGSEHTIMGLVLFGIALAVLFLLQRMLEHWETGKTNS
jgi:exosortase